MSLRYRRLIKELLARAGITWHENSLRNSECHGFTRLPEYPVALGLSHANGGWILRNRSDSVMKETQASHC
jgi:hypothetical protein